MNVAVSAHTSVLLTETIDGLNIKTDGIYIDATFGRGGHSRAILQRLGDNGRLIAFDRDPSAIESANSMIADKRFSIHHIAFAELEDVAARLGIANHIDGILMDIGVSSPQIDEADRGFSFMQDGPLDMRMDTSKGLSAAQWLNSASLDEITFVLKEYGEEKFGKRIAHAVLEERERKPITSTLEFAQIIDKAVPVKDKYKHPATRAFQGVRIFINGELEQLEHGLVGATNVLKSGGRLAVISFHSLEDRMVKRFMRKMSQGKSVPKHLPVMQSELDEGKVLKTIGRAIKPSEREIAANVRSRSSVLRVAEKL
ncbi:16S rRNA (cytosine(1402)-N(4))-methyltransferase RsmH [Ningiella sp. W23]|uniref:16S rRNA (cytosine(1402)-N(4))-methyltransferase RsmH n=1 Tax=Ningiella sp. W23 TaxID=3023715 RepID=UPI003756E323